MSKKHPEDMDFREALPCDFCKTTIECFNVTTGYVGCPNCEKIHPTRAIMRLERFEDTGYRVLVSLMAGPEEIVRDDISKVLALINENGYTVDGVNYSLYEIRRKEQRDGK